MERRDAEALIRRCADLFNKADTPGFLDMLHDDIAHDRCDGGREIGRNSFRHYLASLARHWRSEIGDLVVMTSPDGTRAAAEMTVRGIYLATVDGLPEAADQNFSINAGMFFEFDDGRISRISVNVNKPALKRQLSPQ